MQIDVILKTLLISIFLFIATFIFLSIYLVINSVRLSFYLKKKNYKRWCELTTIGNIGPGLSNPFRGFSYIYSTRDNEDENILRYKNNIRFAIKLAAFMLVAMAINIGLIFIRMTISNGH